MSSEITQEVIIIVEVRGHYSWIERTAARRSMDTRYPIQSTGTSNRV